MRLELHHQIHYYWLLCGWPLRNPEECTTHSGGCFWCGFSILAYLHLETLISPESLNWYWWQLTWYNSTNVNILWTGLKSHHFGVAKSDLYCTPCCLSPWLTSLSLPLFKLSSGYCHKSHQVVFFQTPPIDLFQKQLLYQHSQKMDQSFHSQH